MKPQLPQQKSQNKSIALQPISERESHHFSCQCKLCCSYESNQVKGLLSIQEESFRKEMSVRRNHNYTATHLETVLKHLLLPSNKIVKRGIDIFIPEVCYYEEGQAAHLYYNRDIDDYHLIHLKRDKINHQNMAKLFNERRKTYRDRIRKALSIDSRDSKRENSKISWRGKSKEPKVRSLNLNCVIARFTDGCETILTESDFFQIMHKRKYDPFWKKIYSLKNYIHPYLTSFDDKCIFNVNYDHQKILFKDLEARSFQLMSTYSQRQPPNSNKHISDANEAVFCENLKQSSQISYINYITYKIVAFIATFADEQITNANFIFMINEIGKCFLLDVTELNIKPLLKYDWTNQKYVEMTNKREYDRYHRKELQITPQTTQKSALIESLMSGEYECLKKDFGVTVEPKEDQNQKLNNEFFQSIHPNLHQDLSELVKLDIPFVEFKRKFLGEKDERKTLFRPFNSKFVRELHKLTPLARKSYAPTPEKDIPISWRNRKSESLWKTISH